MPKNKSKKPAIKMPPMPDTHEQRLYDFVSTVGDWIWETNTLLEFTYVSERFEALTGLEESSLLGTTLSQLVLGFPKVSAKNKTIFNLDNKAPFHEIACSLVSESGAIMHFSLSGTPFYDSDGLFCGYRGAAHNITDKLSTYRMPKLAAQDPDAPANETPNPGEAEATEA
ncbi:MAG: PAS domain-containing protein, partial [Rhodospirillaceae bacterium]|nr:PAS domain-containing protein [Rhodospirillaceae bacterium]